MFGKKMKNNKEKQTEKDNRENWIKPEGELVIDVYQTPKEIIVQAPIGGVKTEDLEIVVEDDALEIKGKREKSQTVERKDYLLKECYWGSFSRKITLPQKIKKSEVRADIKKSILTIVLPKKKEEKAKVVKIKTVLKE